jgi:putative Mg2+ transporter-C (MgtC) family protein
MIMTWEFIFRIFVAGLLGGAIGFERGLRAKEAGVRTHFIVALGSALFMIISQYAFTGRFDAARVAAQVVSGIGFIGAGVIIFQKNAVRGVTTAAGLWVAAAIGLSCGAGMWAIAAAAAAMTILCLEMMHFLTKKVGERMVNVSISPIDTEQLMAILDEMNKKGYEIDSFGVTDSKAVFQLRLRNREYAKALHDILSIGESCNVEIS